MTHAAPSTGTDPVNATVKPWRTLNWPNRISILRLLLVAPFAILVMNQNDPGWGWARHAALAIFALMALSDLLDGTLARKLNQRTRLGAILDPLADKALIIFSVILLSLPESAVRMYDGRLCRLPNWVVVAVVGKDLWVICGFVVVYLVTDRFLARPTVAGKASTVGQLVMVTAVLLAPDLERLWAGLGMAVATGLAYLVAGLAVLAGVSYTRLGLLFVAEGQKPLENQSAPTDQQKGKEPRPE